MSFEIVPAHEVPVAEQAELANEAFAGYVGGWKELNAESLWRFLLLQGADLFYSRLIRDAGRLIGFGYINRTGNIARLAAMATVPSARRIGAAGHLLEHLCNEAAERGDEAMVLEVIEQNPPAVALYQRHGFRELGRLTSWRRSAGLIDHAITVEAEAIPILDALQVPSPREFPELPWQISRHAVVKTLKTQTFRAANARIIISDPGSPPIRVYALWSATNDWSELADAIAAILREFQTSEFFAPALWPEDFGENVFKPLGFARDSLTQFLMRRDFT